MQKFILTTLLILTMNYVFAQDRLGYTEYQISHKEFAGKRFDSGYLQNNIKWISWKSQNILTAYYFNKRKVCNFCTIKLLDKTLLTGIIQKYNKDYTIINDSLWQSYLNGDVVSIRLQSSEKGEPYFAFTSRNYPMAENDSDNLSSQTDTSSKNDNFKGTFYSNSKYRFKIHFVDNWDLDKGSDYDNILIGSRQRDSGKLISIAVIDYPTKDLKDEELSKSDINGIKEALELQGLRPTNFKVERGWLNNFPANITTYNFMRRDQTYEIPYFMKQINCFTNGKLYTISISMPTIFYTEDEEDRISKVISSFYFVKFPSK